MSDHMKVLACIYFVAEKSHEFYTNQVLNPRPTKPFCNMLYQGGRLPPPYELAIDGPKV